MGKRMGHPTHNIPTVSHGYTTGILRFSAIHLEPVTRRNPVNHERFRDSAGRLD